MSGHCKFFIVGMLLLTFVLMPLADTNPKNPALEDYRQVRKNSLAADRFTLAKEKLGESRDVEVLNEAIEEILLFADREEKLQEAKGALARVLGHFPKSGKICKKAILANARLFMREGKKQKAKTVFKDAMEKKWDEAQWYYNCALLEAGLMDEAVIEEYNRYIEEGPVGHYKDEDSHMIWFEEKISYMKAKDNQVKAMERVFSNLKRAKQYPNAYKIAKALCVAHDGQLQEGLALLDEADAALQASKGKEGSEIKYIPLYRLILLAKNEKTTDELKPHWEELVKRFGGDFKKAFQALDRVFFSFEADCKDTSKIDELTSLLLDSGAWSTGGIQEQFTEDEISHIYDLHACGLLFSGKTQEAGEMYKEIYEKYYPRTFASAVCGMGYANHLSGEGKFEDAIRILMQILYESPFDDKYIQYAARGNLAKIYKVTGRYSKAMKCIGEGLAFTSEFSHWVEYNWHVFLKELQEQTFQRMISK